MPNFNWNKRWVDPVKKFLEEYKGRPDASIYGYHWARPENSTMGVIHPNFIAPYIDNNRVALEIGPGGVRYTQYLLGFKKIYLVEYTEMFELIKKKFGDCENLVFIKNDGTDFLGIPSVSIDYMSSFDVFVHHDISLISIESYLQSIYAILFPNGVAVYTTPIKQSWQLIRKAIHFLKPHRKLCLS